MAEDTAALLDIYAEDAERALVGAVLIDQGLIHEHELDRLPPEAFSESNGSVWKAALSLYNRDLDVDLVSVTEELRKGGTLDRIGGLSYLIGLSDTLTSGFSAITHAHQVKDAWTRRRLAAVGLRTAASAKRGDADGEELVLRAEKDLYDLTSGERGTGTKRAAEIAEGYIEGGARLPTGFPSIDTVIGGGLPIGDLAILAGRTSMGKSALAHRIAFSVGDTHVMSPDQPLPEIIANETCRRTRIPLDALQRGIPGDGDVKRWREAKRQLVEDMQTTTFDDGSYSFGRMVSDARRAALKGKRLVIVDHIQRIRPDRHYSSRRELLIDITNVLKDIARDFGITVLALSQLSRDIDKRDNRRPLLTDLSESKTIEEDANVVLFLYRDKYYYAGSLAGDIAEIIVAKNKSGKPGRVARLMFRERFVLFEEREPDGEAR